MTNSQSTPSPATAKKKSPGRPKGALGKKTVIKNAVSIMAAAQATINYTDAEIEQMTPLDIIIIAMRLAAKQRNWNLASSLAEKAAPYVHPRAQPKPTDDSGYIIEFIGGLPDA